MGALPHSYSYSHKALFYFNLFLALNLTRYLLLTLTPNLLLGFFTSYSYSGSFLTSIPTVFVSTLLRQFELYFHEFGRVWALFVRPKLRIQM